MRRIWALVLTLLMLASIGGGLSYAEAVSTVPLSIRDLATRSDIIVIGEVLTTQSEWDSTRRVISIRVDMRAQEVLKGAVRGGTLSFFQLGGQMGNITSWVAGTPFFIQGERDLLFLSKRRDGTLGITNLFQGKFTLERDPTTGRETAVRHVPDSAQILDQIPLDQARSQIRTALGR